MGRNPKIDAIHQAWFEWEHCLPAKRAESEDALNRLLDAIVAESDGQCSREQILDHLFSSYKDFRSEMHRNAKVKLAQMQVKKSP